MIEDTKYTVYKHTAPNGKVYIGITKQKPEYRWNNGNGYKDNEHFYRAIRRYDWKNIKHEILETGLTKEQACNREIELIAKYDSTNPDKGYNNTMGGEANIPSKETRRKLSESHKGANHWNYGKHPSAETLWKQSESHKGQIAWNKGVPPSLETRRKISESKKGQIPWIKGKHLSDEHRQKISESKKGSNHHNYGKHLSAETRQKIGESNAKAVICVETGILYSSCTEAAKSIGVVHQTISKAVRGIRKTAGGYHWKYAEA